MTLSCCEEVTGRLEDPAPGLVTSAYVLDTPHISRSAISKCLSDAARTGVADADRCWCGEQEPLGWRNFRASLVHQERAGLFTIDDSFR